MVSNCTKVYQIVSNRIILYKIDSNHIKSYDSISDAQAIYTHFEKAHKGETSQ